MHRWSDPWNKLEHALLVPDRLTIQHQAALDHTRFTFSGLSSIWKNGAGFLGAYTLMLEETWNEEERFRICWIPEASFDAQVSDFRICWSSEASFDARINITNHGGGSFSSCWVLEMRFILVFLCFICVLICLEQFICAFYYISNIYCINIIPPNGYKYNGQGSGIFKYYLDRLF